MFRNCLLCAAGLTLVGSCMFALASGGGASDPAGLYPGPNEKVLFNNWNRASVDNKTLSAPPTVPTTFKVDKPTLISLISNYHWNNGKGPTPGQIGLKHEDGTVYGPWQTTGRSGQNGAVNVNWDCRPSATIKAGTYTVVDSDPASWLQNAGSNQQGFSEVWAGLGEVVGPPPAGGKAGAWVFKEVTYVKGDVNNNVTWVCSGTAGNARGEISTTDGLMSATADWHWTTPPKVMAPGEKISLVLSGDLVKVKPNKTTSYGTPVVYGWEGWIFASVRPWGRKVMGPYGSLPYFADKDGHPRSETPLWFDKNTPVGPLPKVEVFQEAPGIPDTSVNKDAFCEIYVRFGCDSAAFSFYKYVYQWSPTATGGTDTRVTPSPSPGGPTPSPSPISPTPPPGPVTATSLTVQAGTRRAQAGQTVMVPVWLIHGGGVTNMNVVITYDYNVAKSEGQVAQGNLVGSKTAFEFNNRQTGIVKFGLAGRSALEGSDGTLAQIPFVVTGKPGDKTALQVAVTDIGDTGGGAPKAATINGEIVVVGKDGLVPGDSDGDGVLTAADALNALKMSVDLIPVNMVCDMNGDGKVTSTDAKLIMQKVVGK